jgi:hypothetical protein
MTKEEFLKHVDEFEKETMCLSSIEDDNPHFLAIVAAGEEVVPYLVELLYEPNCGIHWPIALNQIVSDPVIVPEELYGRVFEINALWREWARKHNYDV